MFSVLILFQFSSQLAEKQGIANFYVDGEAVIYTNCSVHRFASTLSSETITMQCYNKIITKISSVNRGQRNFAILYRLFVNHFLMITSCMLPQCRPKVAQQRKILSNRLFARIANRGGGGWGVNRIFIPSLSKHKIVSVLTTSMIKFLLEFILNLYSFLEIIILRINTSEYTKNAYKYIRRTHIEISGIFHIEM